MSTSPGDPNAALDEIRAAMKGPLPILQIVYVFGLGDGVQVRAKSRKIGPLLFPPEGGTLADVLTMPAEMRDA